MEKPDTRDCTRCDGHQVLEASDDKLGFGVYECDVCGMRVGYDSEMNDEFIINKGIPAEWTKEVFGDKLTISERRLVKTEKSSG